MSLYGRQTKNRKWRFFDEADHSWIGPEFPSEEYLLRFEEWYDGDPRFINTVFNNKSWEDIIEDFKKNNSDIDFFPSLSSISDNSKLKNKKVSNVNIITTNKRNNSEKLVTTEEISSILNKNTTSLIF